MCLMVSQSAEMHSNKYCMWLSFYFQVLSQFEILNNYEIRKIYKVHTSLKWARALLSSEVSSPNLSYPLNKTPTKQSGVKLQHPTVYLHAIPTKSALFFFKTQSIKANGTCTWKCFFKCFISDILWLTKLCSPVSQVVDSQNVMPRSLVYITQGIPNHSRT